MELIIKIFVRVTIWLVCLSVLSGLLGAVSTTLPFGLKEVGLGTGVILATCGSLAFFWREYRSEATKGRGTSSIAAVDFIVLALAGVAIFVVVALNALAWFSLVMP